MKNESNQINKKIIEIEKTKQVLIELEKEKNKVINNKQQIINNKNFTLQENFENLFFSPETLSTLSVFNEMINENFNEPTVQNNFQSSSNQYKPNSPQQRIFQNSQQVETNNQNYQNFNQINLINLEKSIKYDFLLKEHENTRKKLVEIEDKYQELEKEKKELKNLNDLYWNNYNEELDINNYSTTKLEEKNHNFEELKKELEENNHNFEELKKELKAKKHNFEELKKELKEEKEIKFDLFNNFECLLGEKKWFENQMNNYKSKFLKIQQSKKLYNSRRNTYKKNHD